jgi:tetratricopeptide (TPR) repeat protein
LNHVISADPANGMAFYNRGVAYQRSGNPSKALDDYRSAVRLLPSFAPAHVALAALLDADARERLESPDASQSELSETLRDLDRIIARNGSDSVAYLHRGVANEELGNLQGAIADYSRSIQLAPSAAGYFNRAGVYQRLQEPEKALADFTAALQVDPKYVPALIARAEENYAHGQLPASLEDYSRVIQVDPSNATAYFERGNVLSDLQKFMEAFSDYSESLKLKPDQPDVLYNRAVAAERIGRLKDAENDRRRAQELDNSPHE